jgi:hypothetical protein
MADGWARRAAAAGGAACLGAGGGTVAVAVAATPGLGLTGYVSEAGVQAAPHASAYRLGIFLLATGLALLAVALLPVARLAGVALTAAAALAVVSGSVTCSDGCPLPPFERATGADLVHGGASVAAVAACVGAMLSVAVGGPPALAGLARAALVAAGPLSVAVGLAMLLAGHGTATGVLERALLAVVVGWLLAVGLRLTPRRHGGRSSKAQTSGGNT